MMYNSTISLFEGVCNALRTKEASAEKINHQDIPERILKLKEGMVEKHSFGVINAQMEYCSTN